MNSDEQFMQRALQLAQRGEGLTRPNPPVGAVLVRNGEILSEGFHKKAGGPHAEVNCLNNLKTTPRSLKSASLYVSLEPCSTEGQTPACTDLILECGIGRVVVGCKDPNPAHAGRGIRLLRRKGVQVDVGICRREAQRLIEPFAKRMLTGLPYVTVKLGVTLDGRIADSKGASQWITGPESRKKVQAMRRRADAIMVGAGTVRKDNPSLLPRPAKGRRPWRVIVGKNIPAQSKVLTDEAAERTLIYDGSLKRALRDLAKRGMMHVLCEGGGELAGALVRAGLVDEFAVFTAPSLLGGSGLPMFGQKGWSLAKMPALSFRTLEKCGDDVLLTAVPK